MTDGLIIAVLISFGAMFCGFFITPAGPSRIALAFSKVMGVVASLGCFAAIYFFVSELGFFWGLFYFTGAIMFSAIIGWPLVMLGAAIVGVVQRARQQPRT